MKHPLDLSGYQSATLTFWRYVDDSLDWFEYLKVEAFDGSNWQQIFYWTHRQGDDDTWHQESLDLPEEYLVPNFRLRFTTRQSSSSEEVEIDDVVIYGTR